MADQEKQLIDTVIDNHRNIHHNLEKVQDILSESLSGDDWDRITAVGLAGKLLEVSKQDVNITRACVEDIKKDGDLSGIK